MPTETILDAVWPDSDDSRARACFKVHVHRIRTRLASRTALVYSGERWGLGPDVTTDLAEWRRLASGVGPVPAMEPQRLAVSRAFEEILAGPAPSLSRSPLGPRLDAAFHAMLVQFGAALIDDAFARSDTALAASLARSAIAVDPYGERWHEALIRAQVQRGDLMAARSTLTSYQTTLRAELGVEAPQAFEALIR